MTLKNTGLRVSIWWLNDMMRVEPNFATYGMPRSLESLILRAMPANEARR